MPFSSASATAARSTLSLVSGARGSGFGADRFAIASSSDSGPTVQAWPEPSETT